MIGHPPPKRRRDRIARVVLKWTVVTVLVAGVFFGGIRRPVVRRG